MVLKGLGISTTAYKGGRDGFQEWLEDVEALGFEFVELVSEWPNLITRDNWKRYEEILEGFNLKISVHAPFSDINIGSLNERIRRVSLELLRETMEVASLLNAFVVTVHPGHCSPISVKHRARYTEVHRSALMEIDKFSRESGVRVGVENMPSFPILDAQTPERLAELLEGTELGVTVDVGHLNTVGVSFDEFKRLLGERFVHAHLHDNSGKSDEHLALGEGSVRWPEILPGLRGIGWTLEVLDIESAVKSLEFLKSLHL